MKQGDGIVFHKIKSVSVLSEYKLIVRFAEGISKIYDVDGLFDRISAFAFFRNHYPEFLCVRVDVGGYGIVWNDELDLSCDELWENGKEIDTPFDGLMAVGDATCLWELNESTLRKAIAYGKLIEGVDVCKFGKQWVVSVEAMKREYGELKKKSMVH